MTNLLHIDSSLRQEGSHSRDLARRYVEAWLAGGDDRTVTYRDLATNPPPLLNWDAYLAATSPADGHTPAQATAWAQRLELVTELEAADALLVSAPMYNWAVPAELKAWIDNVIVIGRTLQPPDGGVLAGRPVTVLLAKGGGYSSGSPREAWDHLEPYLRLIFEALGAKPNIISTELTLAGVAPALDAFIDLAAQSRADAERAIDEHAKREHVAA
ncbi:MAG: FMN-dependent NADH-azoreductase [Frankia sp.]